MSSMICVNLVLQTGWLIHGTAYRIGLSANTTNTFKSRLDKFGQNEDVIYNFKHNWTELEVAVKVCVKNISKLGYLSVYTMRA